MKIHFLLLPFLSFVYNSYSQDISGSWLGKSYSLDQDADSAVVYIKIVKDTIANQYSGFSISISNNFYGKSHLSGRYNKKSNKFIFWENDIIESNIPKGLPIFLDKYTLQFKTGSIPSLSGIVHCHSITGVFDKGAFVCDEKRNISLFKTNVDAPVLAKEGPPHKYKSNVTYNSRKRIPFNRIIPVN